MMIRKRSRYAIAITVVLTVGLVAGAVRVLFAQLASSPWPMVQHDLQHTGLSQYDTSANMGGLKWKFTTGNLVHSPALGTDGEIYVGSEDGNLYAINPGHTEVVVLDRKCHLYFARDRRRRHNLRGVWQRHY
jgi:putative pyrroloquinoline-quinone-binding quinoprotein